MLWNSMEAKKIKAPGSEKTGLLHPAITCSTKRILENLHLDARGAFRLWGIFEVTASSAVMLWGSLEIAWRQDSEPLFHGPPEWDEPLSPELQGDDCRWQAKRFWSLRLFWKAALLKRGVGCCYNETVTLQLVSFLLLYGVNSHCGVVTFEAFLAADMPGMSRFISVSTLSLSHLWSWQIQKRQWDSRRRGRVFSV